MDQVFSGGIAAGARGIRAAPEAADRGIEKRDPVLHGGERVGERRAVGIVEVAGEPFTTVLASYLFE